jgi:hypothetical protein
LLRVVSGRKKGPTFAILLKVMAGEQPEMTFGMTNNITQKQHFLLCYSAAQLVNKDYFNCLQR